MIKKLFAIAVCALLSSCDDEEIGYSKDVNQETIFTDYHISYTESSPGAAAIATFRFAGQHGTTLVLSEPSYVSLNGDKLEVDSSQWQGAHYATEIMAQTFTNNHHFVFADINGKTYDAEFRIDLPVISQVTLAADSGLYLSLHHISPGDSLMLNIRDSSSVTEDVHREVVLQKNTINVPDHELQSLSEGPIRVDVYLIRRLPLTEGTKEGGRIIQEFEFKERQLLLKHKKIIA